MPSTINLVKNSRSRRPSALGVEEPTFPCLLNGHVAMIFFQTFIFAPID